MRQEYHLCLIHRSDTVIDCMKEKKLAKLLPDLHIHTVNLYKVLIEKHSTQPKKFQKHISRDFRGKSC